MTPEPRRLGPALGLSLGLHAGLVFVVLILASVEPERVATKAPPIPTNLVYMLDPGPGGGGGGNPAPASAAVLEVPAPRPPVAVPVVAAEAPVEPPPPALDAPVRTDLGNIVQAAGTSLVALAGPGGGGRGPGVGPGDGPGVGPGSKGGTGGGPRGPGAPIVGPTLIRKVPPGYTDAAMRAKIQGEVMIEAVVLANGTVGSVKVIKSLDATYGLDAEALRAARLWLFRPATSGGVPVDVTVTLVLDFRIH